MCTEQVLNMSSLNPLWYHVTLEKFRLLVPNTSKAKSMKVWTEAFYEASLYTYKRNRDGFKSLYKLQHTQSNKQILQITNLMIDNEWEILQFVLCVTKCDNWLVMPATVRSCLIMKCLWIVGVNQYKSIFHCQSFDQEKLNCVFPLMLWLFCLDMAGWPRCESINHVFGGQNLSLFSLFLLLALMVNEYHWDKSSTKRASPAITSNSRV